MSSSDGSSKGRDTSTEYFAQREGEKLAAAIMEKVGIYERYVSQEGLYDVWLQSYRLWYSQDEDGFTSHMIGKKGPKGKFAVLKFNHFRSIVKNWRSLAGSKGAAMQPAVKFSGSRSDEQVKRAKVALDHFWDASDIEKLHDEAVDIASFLGAAHLEQFWDPDGGPVVMPDPDSVIPQNPQGPPSAGGPPGMPPAPPQEPPIVGRPPPVGGAVPAKAGLATVDSYFDRPRDLRTGTIECAIYTPIDAIVDPQAMGHRTSWVVTRKYVNKWDVAAKHAKNQDQYDEIVGLSRPKDSKVRMELNFATKDRNFTSDDIPVYTLWHERTPACPDGLRAVCLNGELLLSADPLGRLEKIPVKRIAPANILRTPFGYSEAWDLLAPQRACDILTSISLSSMRSFGMGSIISPKNSGLTATDIADGLKLLEYNLQGEGSKPDVLKLPTVPTDVWRGQESWVKQMGTLVGVNGVTRGDPEKSLESGSALALVQAQSVQYSADFQAEIIRFMKGCATDTIILVQAFLKSELEFPIMGDEIASMDKFSGADLDQVLRVDVKAVNPMTKTMGGRWQLASFLAEKYPDEVKPRQVINMIAEGSLDPISADIESEERNIQRENALLAKGIGPPPFMIDPNTQQPVLGPDGKPIRKAEPGQTYVIALISDNPIRHAKRHLALLDSPARRSDPKVVQAVLDHVEEHEKLYAMLTAQRPGLLQMMEIPPLQAAIPLGPMGGTPGEGGPPGGGKGPPGGGSSRPSPDNGPPGSGGPTKMPKFPTNPADGERFQPPPTPGESA